MQKPYAELVAQAEQAVSAVKDAELRRVAFERVLNDLLSDGDAASMAETGRSASRKRQSPPASSKPTRTSTSSEAPTRSKRGGPHAYVEELIADGFFKKQKTISEVKAELGNRGHHVPLTSLSGPLQKLCQKRALRRQKIESDTGKKAFGYSNW